MTETPYSKALLCTAAGMAAALLAAGATLTPAMAGNATLNMVLVLDGLRPDSITAEETPNLWRLRQEGVNFLNGHSVFPTVTRANATAIATGTYPGRNGIFGNTLYVREVNPNRAFPNDVHQNLLRLDAVTNGGMVLTESLGEILAKRGKTLAVVSSGSTGSALLANHRAPKGVGILVNGYWEAGVRVAFPDAANEAILRRFPAAPARGGAKEPLRRAGQLDAAGAARLCAARPQAGCGDQLADRARSFAARDRGRSPEARAAIRNNDREVGLLLDRLRALGLADKTNIIVVSDHGFGHSAYGVDVTGELIKAGLKAGPDFDDVVIASSGQTMALHVRDHDPQRIGAVVRFLQQQPWTGVLFMAGKAGGSGVPTEGREPGTFALELVHLAHAGRGPDIVLTFPWSSARSPFGVPGTDYTAAAKTGPLEGTAGNHGSMSPWTVRNTFLAWGADFKKGATVRTPASNVDLYADTARADISTTSSTRTWASTGSTAGC